MKKIKLLLNAIIGNLYKLKIWFHLWFNIKPQRSNQIAQNVIVSLTSYGRRISKCAPYTVFSMIVQTVCPEKITLWIDKDKWNNENLPFALKRMIKWGYLEIEFCKDVRSFTKLVPVLSKYSDKAIITIDDDIYYSSNIIEKLYLSFRKYPDKVNALYVLTYYLDKNNQPKSKIEKKDDFLYEFVHGAGWAGILYPPNCFHVDISKNDLFMKLCPYADDLWFYFMTFLNNVDTYAVENKDVTYYYTDLFYQKHHTGSRLYDTVKVKDFEQMMNIINYYNINKYGSNS